MSLGREFLVSLRIMTHTLVDHMLSFFPDPWKQEPTKKETLHINASIDDLLELSNDLEYMFVHAQKLSKQIVRSHAILRTGMKIKSKTPSTIVIVFKS